MKNSPEGDIVDGKDNRERTYEDRKKNISITLFSYRKEKSEISGSRILKPPYRDVERRNMNSVLFGNCSDFMYTAIHGNKLEKCKEQTDGYFYRSFIRDTCSAFKSLYHSIGGILADISICIYFTGSHSGDLYGMYNKNSIHILFFLCGLSEYSCKSYRRCETIDFCS